MAGPMSPLPIQKQSPFSHSAPLHPSPSPTAPTLHFSAAPDKPSAAKTPKKPSNFWRNLKIAFWTTFAATTYAGISYPLTFSNIHFQTMRFMADSNVHFKYFVPDNNGGFQESFFNLKMTKAEYDISRRIMEILQDKPKFREMLKKMPNGGLEIRLYDASSMKRSDSEHAHVGLAEIKNGKVAMEFSVSATTDGIELTEDAHEVVCHELGHILDYLGDIENGDLSIRGADGFLPGWSSSQKIAFEAARQLEIPKIKNGTSPMDAYGLTNEKEFLAVAIETFFEKPAELKASNPTIYRLLSGFFDLDPGASPLWSAIKGPFHGDFSLDYLYTRDQKPTLYMFGGMTLLLTSTGWVIRRRQKKAATESPEIPTPTLDDLLKKYR